MAAYQEDMDDIAENYRRFIQFCRQEYVEARTTIFYGLGETGFDHYTKYKEGAKSAYQLYCARLYLRLVSTKTSQRQPRSSKSSKKKSSKSSKKGSSKSTPKKTSRSSKKRTPKNHDKQRQRRRRLHRRRRPTPLLCRVSGVKRHPTSTVIT